MIRVMIVLPAAEASGEMLRDCPASSRGLWWEVSWSCCQQQRPLVRSVSVMIVLPAVHASGEKHQQAKGRTVQMFACACYKQMYNG